MADFEKFVEQLKDFDLSDIDFNRVGVWPFAGKLVLCVIVAAAIIAACYFLIVKDKQLELDAQAIVETGLKKEFQTKAFEAANLEQYRQQLAKMEESFDVLKSRLPQDTEVADLLEDIDDKAIESRLSIDKIGMQPEVVTEVHIELPISIQVFGGFHEFGTFVSGIAGMPRIVTLHDFNIRANRDNNGLQMTMQAKTYKYKAEE